MSKAPKRPRDPNQLAKFIADLATGEAEEQAQPSDGRRAGGLVGGNARAEKLSAEKRKQIAEKAAAARWGNKH